MPSSVVKLTLAETRARLPLPATIAWPLGVWDVEALRHGTMSLLLFAPSQHDFQTSHPQDEIYVVIAGHAELVIGHDADAPLERQPCDSGDALFVPAGTLHRFENFSEDFATWAIFWGPHGGEKSVRLPVIDPL